MDTKPNTLESDVRLLVQRGIDRFGSQAALASAIGYSQQYISLLLREGGQVSGEFAVAFDAATSGEVSKHVFRPDLFGTEPVRRSVA